jgi:hypothetical protein
MRLPSVGLDDPDPPQVTGTPAGSLDDREISGAGETRKTTGGSVDPPAIRRLAR